MVSWNAFCLNSIAFIALRSFHLNGTLKLDGGKIVIICQRNSDKCTENSNKKPKTKPNRTKQRHSNAFNCLEQSPKYINANVVDQVSFCRIMSIGEKS